MNSKEMNPTNQSELKSAIHAIRLELKQHEAKFTSIGNTINDDIIALRANRHADPWAWETTMRRTHMIITRKIANLPFIQLYYLAFIGNPKALWKFPYSLADTIPNRRKLLAYAMRHLVQRILL